MFDRPSGGDSSARATRRLARPKRLTVVLLTSCVAVANTWLTAGAAPQRLSFTMRSGEGGGIIERPGLPCDEGGTGSGWHYDWEAALPAGVFSELESTSRVHFDLHSERTTPEVRSAAGAAAAATKSAFLLDRNSQLALANQRGALRLALQAGSCASPELFFDGTTVNGDGTWTVDGGTGAYRDAVGSGIFSLEATSVAPGHDNDLNLTMDGSIEVLQPDLKISVERVYWANLGLDFLIRRPTVVYRVENVGPGDAYGVRLVAADAATDGVTLAESAIPQHVGDLLVGELELVRLRWDFGLLRPCLIASLCQFRSVLDLEWGDAMGVAEGASVGPVAATTPLPGLSP